MSNKTLFLSEPMVAFSSAWVAAEDWHWRSISWRRFRDGTPPHRGHYFSLRCPFGKLDLPSFFSSRHDVGS